MVVGDCGRAWEGPAFSRISSPLLASPSCSRATAAVVEVRRRQPRLLGGAGEAAAGLRPWSGRPGPSMEVASPAPCHGLEANCATRRGLPALPTLLRALVSAVTVILALDRGIAEGLLR